MSELKARVLTLLQESIFVTQEMRSKILGKIDQLSEHQLELVITVLEDANGIQKNLIKKYLIKHPELTEELKAYSISEIKKEWQGIEQDNTKEEISTIENLEKELNDLT